MLCCCRHSLTEFNSCSTADSEHRHMINSNFCIDANNPTAFPLVLPSLVVSPTCSIVSRTACSTTFCCKRCNDAERQFQHVSHRPLRCNLLPAIWNWRSIKYACRRALPSTNAYSNSTVPKKFIPCRFSLLQTALIIVLFALWQKQCVKSAAGFSSAILA